MTQCASDQDLSNLPYILSINGNLFHETNYKGIAEEFFRFISGEKFSDPTVEAFVFGRPPMNYAEYLNHIEDWKGIKLNGLLELWEGEPKGEPLMSAEVPRQWDV